jgi:hypothetical protein
MIVDGTEQVVTQGRDISSCGRPHSSSAMGRGFMPFNEGIISSHVAAPANGTADLTDQTLHNNSTVPRCSRQIRSQAKSAHLSKLTVTRDDAPIFRVTGWRHCRRHGSRQTTERHRVDQSHGRDRHWARPGRCIGGFRHRQGHVAGQSIFPPVCATRLNRTRSRSDQLSPDHSS